MNMRRVVAEKQKHAAGEEKGELDILLEKGAISRDQYDRLKGFFKQPGPEGGE
jgi:hypothetical protein